MSTETKSAVQENNLKETQNKTQDELKGDSKVAVAASSSTTAPATAPSSSSAVPPVQSKNSQSNVPEDKDDAVPMGDIDETSDNTLKNKMSESVVMLASAVPRADALKAQKALNSIAEYYGYEMKKIKDQMQRERQLLTAKMSEQQEKLQRELSSIQAEYQAVRDGETKEAALCLDDLLIGAQVLPVEAQQQLSAMIKGIKSDTPFHEVAKMINKPLTMAASKFKELKSSSETPYGSSTLFDKATATSHAVKHSNNAKMAGDHIAPPSLDGTVTSKSSGHKHMMDANGGMGNGTKRQKNSMKNSYLSRFGSSNGIHMPEGF